MEQLFNLIVFLCIGALAGYLAGLMVKGRGFGLLGNLIVGIIGAFAGGLILWAVGLQATGLVGALTSATLGAVVLLLIFNALLRR